MSKLDEAKLSLVHQLVYEECKYQIL